MRWLLALAVLASCTEHGKGGGVFCTFMGMTHQVGDQFPAGDNCNFCDCDIDGRVVCTTNTCGDGGLPDASSACNPSGGCANGPLCGSQCCGTGESCGSNGLCTCGGNASCTNGNTCQSGGPVGAGFCGSICCGGTTGCPI